MTKYEAGFIGAGNMGGALASAAVRKVTGEKVAVACSSPARSAAAAAANASRFDVYRYDGMSVRAPSCSRAARPSNTARCGSSVRTVP